MVVPRLSLTQPPRLQALIHCSPSTRMGWSGGLVDCIVLFYFTAALKASKQINRESQQRNARRRRLTGRTNNPREAVGVAGAALRVESKSTMGKKKVGGLGHLPHAGRWGAPAVGAN